VNVNALIGTHDVLFLVLDTLRFDVASQAKTPCLRALIPGGQWEQRHAPGNFTYASHQAFFAGFLPTPARPGRHVRLFSTKFEGSETTTEDTCVFPTRDIVSGFASRGYRTVCIGGVGFFNPANALGQVLPAYFQESHYSAETSVTAKDSTRAQVAIARRVLSESAQKVFLFINVSALHQPNCHYVPGATRDSLQTHAAALEYVDSQLPPLFEALRARGPCLSIVCSDHGTAYGEDGFHGHRLNHPVVANVPYAEFVQ